MEWIPTKLCPPLGVNELHLWRVCLSDLAPKVRELRLLLSKEEQARSDRYVRPADVVKFMVGRAVLRLILAQYLGLEPGEIMISTGKFGKPHICKSFNINYLTFNLSHSGEVCLVAVSHAREIGVDVEKLRDDVLVEDLATRYFSAEEVAELQALPIALRRLGFFLCWTRKEAYVKAKALGLQIPLDRFSVSLTPGQPAEIRGAEAGGWTILSFEPRPGYVAAVVSEGPMTSVKYCDYIG
jgi:4'-phosphopantetheinyl transferase